MIYHTRRLSRVRQITYTLLTKALPRSNCLVISLSAFPEIVADRRRIWGLLVKLSKLTDLHPIKKDCFVQPRGDWVEPGKRKVGRCCDGLYNN